MSENNNVEFLKNKLTSLQNRWKATVNVENAAKVKIRLAREYRQQLKKLNVLLEAAKQSKLPTPFDMMSETDKEITRNKKG